MKTKRSIKNQRYEKYWKLTLEYTDYKDVKFNTCLSIIVDYIDKKGKRKLTKKEYSELQSIVDNFNPKADLGSVRKSINQFLKLGFLKNGLSGYHKKTKDFLKETNFSRKKRIYSEILYDNSSFSRSYSRPTDTNEINFLIKTLEYCGKLSKEELLALMHVDVSKVEKGYLTIDELKDKTNEISDIKFMKRKYNQLSYLWGICKNILTGIYYYKDYGYITIDKPEVSYCFLNRGRDSYKQRLYKEDLYYESRNLNNGIQCYIENLRYPVLIASHIKPYRDCLEEEQFDVENGLLLSKNIDLLFDYGWITFDNTGEIIFNSNLDKDIIESLKGKKLERKYLTNRRLQYLEYHRNNVFDNSQNYSTSMDS